YVPGARIGHVHGMLQRAGGRFVFPMYHPAAALHQGSLRATLFDDVRRLPAALLEARRALEPARDSVAIAVATAAHAAAERAEQMKLF
ncbi:MAG: uracil-DNA glycosylase, partial [Chloroflexota bacterium]|nr:uracil-DNA glycosylase [Chloroflexota bacterium]